MIPDSLVEEVGRATEGNDDYDLGVFPGGNDGSNSNGYADAIIGEAARRAGVNHFVVPMPKGWHPNSDTARNVKISSCTQSGSKSEC